MSTPAEQEQLMPIRTAIQRVVDGKFLSIDEAGSVMDQIMTGQASGAQIGALVTAMRMRGETIDEIAGFARAMRTHALHVDVDLDSAPVVDTCGTGGDASNTFNISTTASFAIAGAGVKVAKHGNRAMTSKCGSADLLEGLGVRIELAPDEVLACINEVGIGFMFAPAFHPAMRYVGPSRREIGIRTVFNVLGPLTNPAGARHQLIGVGHPDIAPKLASVLGLLGSSHAVLVHAEEGLDELGLSGPSIVTEWDERIGATRVTSVAPDDLGLQRATLADLVGGDVKTNVGITLAILNGERGPRRDATLLNAGAGLFAANAADSIADGIRIAGEAIDSGKALATMNHLVEKTQSFAKEPVTA
jgi:anthranilate phosphoribosyltransferase